MFDESLGKYVGQMQLRREHLVQNNKIYSVVGRRKKENIELQSGAKEEKSMAQPIKSNKD